MESLQEKVSKLLQQRFGRRATVEIESDADGISGKVISTKFRGVDMRDRVDMVYDTLEDSLSPAERRQIVIIGPFTPEETRED
jgi:acid stress-induced BolA-like protein IbaG/YrbA